MLVPVRVMVPAVVLFKATAPARIALAEPLFISKPPVLVSVPPEPPVMLPPLSTVTVPTESVKVSIDRIAVAPSTVTAPVRMALLIPYSIVPALTVVKPV